MRAGEGEWRTRTLVNATGTWTRPFVPFYPGIASFTGEQVHTAHYPGPQHFRGKRVLVVGGGASAVQFLGELAPVTETLWVTRRPPVWRDDFDASAGLAAVTAVEDRVRRGLPPASVVSVTGLALRPQEQEAARLGAYERLPMFDRIEADAVRWADGRSERVDAILWATGFRPAVDHLSPLGLRTPEGGIALEPVPGNVQGATTAVRDPRVQLVGYGPSASTIGASRAGRQAALAVSRFLEPASDARELGVPRACQARNRGVERLGSEGVGDRTCHHLVEVFHDATTLRRRCVHRIGAVGVRPRVLGHQGSRLEGHQDRQGDVERLAEEVQRCVDAPGPELDLRLPRDPFYPLHVAVAELRVGGAAPVDGAWRGPRASRLRPA